MVGSLLHPVLQGLNKISVTCFILSKSWVQLCSIRCLDYYSRFYSVFLQALSGFLMMMTQNGKLLYISDNAAEYLGHSMVSTSEFVHVGAAYRRVWRGSRLIFFVIAQEFLSEMILCYISVTFRCRTTHECQKARRFARVNDIFLAGIW